MFVKGSYAIQIFLLSLSEMNCFVMSNIALLSILSKCPEITTAFANLKILWDWKEQQEEKIFRKHDMKQPGNCNIKQPYLCTRACEFSKCVTDIPLFFVYLSFNI